MLKHWDLMKKGIESHSSYPFIQREELKKCYNDFQTLLDAIERKEDKKIEELLRKHRP